VKLYSPGVDSYPFVASNIPPEMALESLGAAFITIFYRGLRTGHVTNEVLQSQWAAEYPAWNK